MSDDEVLVETEGRVAIVTINRPQRRNAMTRPVITALQEGIRDLDADDGIGAIILTGADPSFSAGMDLKEMQANPAFAKSIGPLPGPAVVSGTPLIGAVNGAAYTGGLELALCCHFLIASEKAVFGDTHARMGVMPGWGLTVHLAEAVGIRRARQMSTTSLPIDAQTALAWGLVNEVVPHEQLMVRARELAIAAAANDPLASRRQLGVYEQQRAVIDDNAWLVEAAAFRKLDEDRVNEPNRAF